MKVIRRTKETGTCFKLIDGKFLPKYKIVQIITPQIYNNEHGYGVFLCEIEKESEEEQHGN